MSITKNTFNNTMIIVGLTGIIYTALTCCYNIWLGMDTSLPVIYHAIGILILVTLTIRAYMSPGSSEIVLTTTYTIWASIYLCYIVVNAFIFSDVNTPPSIFYKVHNGLLFIAFTSMIYLYNRYAYNIF